MPSFILIPPTVWPQYTALQIGQDRQDNGPIAWGNRFTNGRPKSQKVKVSEFTGVIYFEVNYVKII